VDSTITSTTGQSLKSASAQAMFSSRLSSGRDGSTSSSICPTRSAAISRRSSIQSGDAMACRYINTDAAQKVIVVDGRTRESGEELVDHIITHYGTTHVDHVINTHPDADRASGLAASDGDRRRRVATARRDPPPYAGLRTSGRSGVRGRSEDARARGHVAEQRTAVAHPNPASGLAGSPAASVPRPRARASDLGPPGPLALEAVCSGRSEHRPA
jgi:hypothetical protein